MGVSAMTRKSTFSGSRRDGQRGFSLLEVMVALALGAILMAGIITLFSNMSGVNRVQTGLARLQENGRFALMRMENDLRMAGAQYCSTTSGAGTRNTLVPIIPPRAPMVYAKTLGWDRGSFSAIDADGEPTNEEASQPYALSPRWFIQGHSCDASNCTPEILDDEIPDMGLEEGKRVPATDVLTVRYLRGTGWPIPAHSCSISAADPLAGGTVITVSMLDGDDENFDQAFKDDNPLALVSDCVTPAILPIKETNPGSNTSKLTVADEILPGATGQLCNGSLARDARLFDFSRDFVTVSYYLEFRKDENPGARPNSAAATRLVPVLIRRENGVPQELVRGVDLLAFNYGVQRVNGSTQFLDAAAIQNAAASECTPPPDGMSQEPGCLWRSVRTIEPRLLVNTVDEVMSLDPVSRSYRFNGMTVGLGDDDNAHPNDDLPSGLKSGSMSRREFVGYFSVRNGNF